MSQSTSIVSLMSSLGFGSGGSVLTPSARLFPEPDDSRLAFSQSSLWTGVDLHPRQPPVRCTHFSLFPAKAWPAEPARWPWDAGASRWEAALTPWENTDPFSWGGRSRVGHDTVEPLFKRWQEPVTTFAGGSLWSATARAYAPTGPRWESVQGSRDLASPARLTLRTRIRDLFDEHDTWGAEGVRVLTMNLDACIRDFDREVSYLDSIEVVRRRRALSGWYVQRISADESADQLLELAPEDERWVDRLETEPEGLPDRAQPRETRAGPAGEDPDSEPGPTTADPCGGPS